jgi:pre-mRNA cleavage complex 2 protein Pcf11
VPDDPVLASSHCPICQEKFETKWDYNVDEFVWTDARKVGERIFHASCYAEAAKDLNSLLKRNTPEPVLGKRKAEVSLLRPAHGTFANILTGGSYCFEI